MAQWVGRGVQPNKLGFGSSTLAPPFISSKRKLGVISASTLDGHCHDPMGVTEMYQLLSSMPGPQKTLNW